MLVPECSGIEPRGPNPYAVRVRPEVAGVQH